MLLDLNVNISMRNVNSSILTRIHLSIETVENVMEFSSDCDQNSAQKTPRLTVIDASCLNS